MPRMEEGVLPGVHIDPRLLDDVVVAKEILVVYKPRRFVFFWCSGRSSILV